jgi:hypothetical protein
MHGTGGSTTRFPAFDRRDVLRAWCAQLPARRPRWTSSTSSPTRAQGGGEVDQMFSTHQVIAAVVRPANRTLVLISGGSQAGAAAMLERACESMEVGDTVLIFRRKRLAARARRVAGQPVAQNPGEVPGRLNRPRSRPPPLIVPDAPRCAGDGSGRRVRGTGGPRGRCPRAAHEEGRLPVPASHVDDPAKPWSGSSTWAL